MTLTDDQIKAIEENADMLVRQGYLNPDKRDQYVASGKELLLEETDFEKDLKKSKKKAK